ncbi:uncharacterized protein [Dysidea avara]|uniref:uncharacterized protein n=1 Tax=Dysidea avara TaxID=196820 RepID=UPI00331E60C3
MAEIPRKLLALSIAELDGKVYTSVTGVDGVGCTYPFVYDLHEDCWFSLPDLPYWKFVLVTIPDRKQLLAIGGVSSTNDGVKVTNKVFQWDEKWLTPYPDIPTARCSPSCVSHGSSVMVAGGVTVWNPMTMTRSVEVLHITDTDSHWSVVEQLPHVTRGAVPLIVNDNLYIAVGCDEDDQSTCNVVTASLPQLLQSGNNTSSGQVWNKLPDMPYSSYSIKGCLITFTGDHLVEQPGEDKPVWKLVPLIHISNPDIKPSQK